MFWPHHSKAVIALFGMLTVAACEQDDAKGLIRAEGPALFFRSGAVRLIDLSHGRATYGFLGSPALEDLKSKGIFNGVPRDCLVVVYRLRAEGQLIGENSIHATKMTLVGRYSRPQLDDELNRIRIEALHDPQVCPSA